MNDKVLAAMEQLETDTEITIGQKYDPAMGIVSQEMADVYFEALVLHNMVHWNQSREEAESIQRQNLGYYAGYCGGETQDRVNQLFCTVHPTFGG